MDTVSPPVTLVKNVVPENTLILNFNSQNATYDLFNTEVVTCVAFGTPDGVFDWLSSEGYKSSNYINWEK